LGRGRSGGENNLAMKQIKIVVEKHPDGYVAYPLGVKGVVVGQGDSYEDGLADVRSALRFHGETFGSKLSKPTRLSSKPSSPRLRWKAEWESSRSTLPKGKSLRPLQGFRLPNRS
jgi:hypothetical protein